MKYFSLSLFVIFNEMTVSLLYLESEFNRLHEFNKPSEYLQMHL